jgi:hypothetical protein
MVALLVAVAPMAGCAITTEQPAPTNVVPMPKTVPNQWLGSGSCASMGCHNANGLKGEPRSEYTTWVTHDPHARAYEVLYNTRSRTIVANLKTGKPAHQDSLCLNCHVHKDYEKEKANHQPLFAKEDGVGCESCHGPASGWISEHYRIGGNVEQKLALGMWDTWSLAGRVRSCTPCHVGAAGMDVNHDLIAAGHPRLAFEFSAYHALMPHHWPDAKDRQPGASAGARADWDAAAWFVGEAAATQAALELLASRADKGVWPEFAEYDCYACHHQLQDKSWRQKRDATKRKPGSLAWNDWYVSPLPYQVHPGKADPKGAPKQVAALRKMMEQKAPDQEAVHKQAREAAKAMQEWARQFKETQYTTKDLSIIMRQIASHGAEQEAGSWDEAAQTYLAVTAIYQALRHAKGAKSPPPDLKDALAEIRRCLQFQKGSDSPLLTFTPQQLLEPYALLLHRLGS